jgi:hypothetical protein
MSGEPSFSNKVSNGRVGGGRRKVVFNDGSRPEMRSIKARMEFTFHETIFIESSRYVDVDMAETNFFTTPIDDCQTRYDVTPSSEELVRELNLKAFEAKKARRLLHSFFQHDG